MRKGQASALLSFITTVQTAANDPDVIILGDLNAYSQGGPDGHSARVVLDLAKGEHSYAFDGQSGSLDHAMVTPSLMTQVTNAGIWNINADEPIVLITTSNSRTTRTAPRLPARRRTITSRPRSVRQTTTRCWWA